MKWLHGVIVLVPLALGGCMVGPDYHRPHPPLPGGWDASAVKPADHKSGGQRSRVVASPMRVARWWVNFRDPRLNALIDQAASANLSVKQAGARVREARAQRGVVMAGLYPNLSASGSYNYQRLSENGLVSQFGGGGGSGGSEGAAGGGGASNAPLAAPAGLLGHFNLYQVGFDASWELDVFGGTRRAVQAANAVIGAAVEDRRDVLVTLLGEVARNYVELRGLQRRMAVAKQNLQAQRQSLKLTRRRFKNGLTPQIDVSRARAQVATTAAQFPTLKTRIRQSIHRLSVLLGRPPDALSKQLSTSAPIPPVPARVPVGLPSDLLRRRPDIRRAERRLAAATARIGVAVAQLYPRFNLTGTGGLQAVEPEHLGEYASRFFGFNPTISWPIFQGGRIRGRIRVQNAREAQAMLAYKQTILTALREVDDALVAYDKEQKRLASLKQAVEANRQATRLAQALYKQGLRDFLTVLDAQRRLYQAQDAMVRSRTAVSADLVALYKALGGGWQVHRPGSTAMTSQRR